MTAPAAPETPAPAPGMERPGLVLDTNVLLDWLVFRDPSAVPVGAAITGERVVWWATPAMLEELERVLTYTNIAALKPDSAGVLAMWARWSVAPTGLPAPAPMDCADPDDQKFIDLAIGRRARWLLTRDRELLRLATKAASYGVRVLTPLQWAAVHPFEGLNDQTASGGG